MEEDKKIFVGGLPLDVKSEKVREYFSHFGPVTNVDVKMHSSGRGRGFGFVTFEDSESVEKAIAMETHKIMNCKVGIKKAEVKQGKIYIGNLPTEGVTNEEIKTHFEAFGAIVEVVRPVDKTKNNEPKNFAFITFEREETAKQLVKEGSTKDKEITIGQPDIEDYNCHASVAFSHNYFKKNNNETATCLTCEKMNKSTKDKTMMRNAVLTTCQGSTSGILSFINYYWSSLIF